MTIDKQEAVAIHDDVMFCVDSIENLPWPLWPRDVLVYRPGLRQSLSQANNDRPEDVGKAGIVLIAVMKLLHHVSEGRQGTNRDDIWRIVDEMHGIVEVLIESDLISVSTAGISLMECWTHDH